EGAARRALGGRAGPFEPRSSPARRRLRVRLTRRGIPLGAAAVVTVPASLARAAVGLARGPARPNSLGFWPGGFAPMSVTVKGAALAAAAAVPLVAAPGAAGPPKDPPAKSKPADPPPAADPMKVGFPKGWGGGAFGMGEYAIGLDTKTFKSGKAAGFIRADKPGNGATLTQMIAPKDLAGKRVRLTAQVKTKGADPGAGLWMRIDTPDGTQGFDNMWGRKVAGDNDWATAEVVLDVPEKATGIAFGMILFGGKGTVWIDDVKLEAVGKDVKVTAETPAEAGGEGLANSDGLPEAPVNLGFEDGQRAEARVQA